MYCTECYHKSPKDALFCENCGRPFSDYKEGKNLVKKRYEIISPLSEGGDSDISVGFDTKLSKPCAIKSIEYEGLQDLTFEEKQKVFLPFIREAEILSRLRNLNLPSITDYFIEDDICYLVMDYIAGKDLELVLEEEGPEGLPEKQVMEWAIQICRILEYLHSQQPPVIHGDIKSANLIIRDSDRWLMLVDFANCTIETLSNEEKEFYGTIGYAAPEQYEGRMEEKSDIYALGVTLYELLTGIYPEKDLDFIPVRELKEDLHDNTEKIVMKCLERKPENRFSSATELKKHLLAAYKNNFGTGETPLKHIIYRKMVRIYIIYPQVKQKIK